MTIPAVGGATAFVRALDALVRRRPRRDPWLPILRLRGLGADRMVVDYGRRLVRGVTPIVPHVVIDGSAVPDDIQLLDLIFNRLRETMPPGTGRLRPYAYRFTRAALDIAITDFDDHEGRRTLRDTLYDTRGPLRELVEAGDDAAQGFQQVGAVARLVGRWAALRLFGAWLRFGRRFRWLRKQPGQLHGRDYLAAALCLTEGRPARANAALVHRVLVLALLHDLDAATRRSLVSPSKRRRVAPFTVLIANAEPASPARRFVDTFGSLHALQHADEGVPKRCVMLVMASVDGGDDGGDEGGSGLGLDEAADALRGIARRHRAGAEPGLLVDVPAEPVSQREQDDLAVIPEVSAPRPPLPRLVPAAVGTTAVLAAALVAWLILRDADPRCPRIEETGGEVIGVGDGTADCSFFEDATGQRGELVDEMVAVEDAIARENAEVLADHERGQPYSTIVFFAPLTVPNEPERQDENALNQLRGIHMAQQRANDLADNDANRIRTRVVIANPGDRFVHGLEVAERIADEAGEDETVVGVVGISQSRDASFEAIRLLGEEGLPVVAGPVTGDNMLNSSQYYYQVGPRNARVADMLVEFSANTEIVSAGDGEMVTPDGAVIVTDHSDYYSANLADDLYDELGSGQVETISYAVEDPDSPLPDPGSDTAPATRVHSLYELADQVCASMGGRDVLFFTSRSSQFVGMLDNMHNNNDCPDTYTVVAGSAVTKLVENRPDLMSEHPGVSLYYAAFGSREVSYGGSSDEFVALYQEAYDADTGTDGGAGTDVSDAALAYDAFNALQMTGNYAQRNGFPISADTSAEALGGDEIEFDGASGYVALGNEPLGSQGSGHQRVPPEKPVLVLRAGDGRSEPELACGRFSQDENRTTWGADRRPCPAGN